MLENYRNSESLSLSFHCSFSGQEADLGVGPVTERFIRGCAAAAQRDRLSPADVYFFAISISDFQLAQVSADNVRAGLFDQNIDCHLVPPGKFHVKQSIMFLKSRAQQGNPIARRISVGTVLQEEIAPNSSLNGGSDPSCAKPAFGISEKADHPITAITRSTDFFTAF
jgi:hypothetical protein